jgi:hypothetical protein
MQHGLDRYVGFLEVYAPISQFFKRDGRSGDGATDESAGSNHAKIAVKVPDFRLTRDGRCAVITVQHNRSPWLKTLSLSESAMAPDWV